MTLKYNKTTLKKLEEIFKSAEFVVRYEKGQFKSGYCLLRDKKIIIINKFFDIKGRIDSLIDISQQIEFDTNILDDSARKLLSTIEKNYLQEATEEVTT